MTNREWVQTLTDEEFTRMLMTWSPCEYCVGQSDIKKCREQPTCRDGRLKWFEQEHEENVTK